MTKLFAKVITTKAGYTAAVLVDEHGDMVPGQEWSSLEANALGKSTFTVRFVLDRSGVTLIE